MSPIARSSGHCYRPPGRAAWCRTVAGSCGGAHWGGGLRMSANDLALLGELYLRRGRWSAKQLLSEE